MCTSLQLSTAVNSRERIMALSLLSINTDCFRYPVAQCIDRLSTIGNYVPNKLLYIWHCSSRVRCYYIGYYAGLSLEDFVHPLAQNQPFKRRQSDKRSQQRRAWKDPLLVDKS